MDLTGLPALDLAIGLSFVFLLLSLFASTVNEAIAQILALRAKTLEKGLRNMLEALPKDKAGATLTKELYAHPFIKAFYKSDRRGPSYISPRSFALALVDTIAPKAAEREDGKMVTKRDVIENVRVEVEKLPDQLKRPLLVLLNDARDDIDQFRTGIEQWFDDTMARVSGWYKRQSQWILIGLACVVTVSMNANALTIGERLWKDPAVRAAVVDKAVSTVGTPEAETKDKTAIEQGQAAAQRVEDLSELGIPIGWTTDADDPRHVEFPSVKFWYRDLLGWLLTIGAVSLGAPFWFDALSRLARLRGTGKPEAPLPASAYGQRGERVP